MHLVEHPSLVAGHVDLAASAAGALAGVLSGVTGAGVEPGDRAGRGQWLARLEADESAATGVWVGRHLVGRDRPGVDAARPGSSPRSLPVKTATTLVAAFAAAVSMLVIVRVRERAADHREVQHARAA